MAHEAWDEAFDRGGFPLTNWTPTSGPWRVVAILRGRIVGDETAQNFDKLQICGPNSTVATVYHRQDARLICEMRNQTT